MEQQNAPVDGASLYLLQRQPHIETICSYQDRLATTAVSSALDYL
ncbi:MAG: hypothetical protein ACREPR_26430 [Brasilonema sp.]